MGLILTDAGGNDVCEVADYDLDLAFGDDENDFELTLREGPRLTAGCRAYMDGTEYGGVVDSVATDTEKGTVTYSGRTWQGVLAGKVISPPAGADYLTVSGDARQALSSLIASMGLGGVFDSGGGGDLEGAYRFDRYVDGYTGIRKMLRASGLRLGTSYESGRVVLSAERVATWGDDVDSDRADFKAQRTYRPVNHLVCLGKGELRDRVVIHLYADARGSVSRTQSLTGIDERAEVYDYSSAEEGELLEKGVERLLGMQGDGSIDVTVRDGGGYAVGDLIAGRDSVSGLMVTAEVVKKILRVEGGVMSVDYECGEGTARAGFA